MTKLQNIKTWKIKNKKNKKTQTNLLNQINLSSRDPWDPKSELNKKTQSSNNLILNDEIIKKKINLKFNVKVKKNTLEN